MSDLDGLPTPRLYNLMKCNQRELVLSSLDSAIATIALPTIAREAGASDAGSVWVVNGYPLAAAVCLLPAAGMSGAALILSVARWPWLLLVNLPVCAMGCRRRTAVSLTEGGGAGAGHFPHRAGWLLGDARGSRASGAASRLPQDAMP